MKTFPSYAAAVASLPADKVLQSTFGNPGEGGFAALFQTKDGACFRVLNGRDWRDQPPFTWTVNREEAGR